MKAAPVSTEQLATSAEVNRGVTKWKLSALWDEVELPVTAEPNSGDCVVRRLDGEALVLDGNPQVSSMIGLGLVQMLLGLAFGPYMTWSMVSGALQLDGPNRVSILVISLITAVITLGGLCFAAWLCYMGLIQRSPSPIIFNRKTGKVYGSHRGKPLVLDWPRVRPVLTKAKIMYAGAQTHYHLVLMNFDAGQEGPMKKKTGHGLMVATGGLYGAEQCRELWEFIRRYMEGKPQGVPLVEVTPETDPWVSKVLDTGPYWEFNNPGDRSIETLRGRKGRPVLRWWQIPFAWFMSPALLINLYQIFVRPRVKLPQAWWPASPTEPNPYQTREPAADDAALRRTAARWVIALWLVLGVGVGCLLWVRLVWWVTHLHL